jgi:predicted ribonuclease YlaK
MANKYRDIRYKWLEERGFNVLADEHQLAYVKSLFAPVNEVRAVFCEAKAGTGKTTLAVLAGVYEVEAGTYDKIIYVRNAIPIRDMGFLPGDVDDKQEPYMAPLIQAMDRAQPGLFDFWSKSVVSPPKVFATTTAYTRGITWERAFVILDEAQNFDLEELRAVYTRVTDDCKVVTTGSLRQNDNRKQKRYAGFTPMEVYMKHFDCKDYVRYHTLVRNYRGDFADYSDDVDETIRRLENKEM